MKDANEVVDAETIALFGGVAPNIESNNDEREVQLALRTVRDCLLETAERDNVGVNQLAKRLDISPSSVSRFFSSEGDIRVSTAVLYARALGCLWNFSLYPDSACTVRGNQSGKPELSVYDVEGAKNGSGTPQIRQLWGTTFGRPATFVAPSDPKINLKATA
jgi:transcriptional regulator with XRE-family HTH domain